MPKVDKKNFTKEEWRAFKANRKLAKLVKIEDKEIEDQRDFSQNICFVVGNGTSRQSINLLQLKKHGKVYACNAVYREFIPDWLIAVDTKMVREITSNAFHLYNKVYTNPNRYTRDIPGLHLAQPSLGWSSGPTALNLAAEHGFDKIYILGFDYVGSGKNNERVNNIYAGTLNYKKETDRATYFGNWSRQTSTTIKKHPSISYTRVVEDGRSFVPDNLIGLKNLKHITVENFIKKFNLSVK